MNYNNNQNQMDLGYEQSNNNLLNNGLLNNIMIGGYGLNDPSKSLQPTYISANGNQQNLFSNMSNDNLINMANSIDPNSLNGTSLDDNGATKIYSNRNKNNDNTSLIKSLTKEIINNLKENNMSLYDNSSINSRNIKINSSDIDNDYLDDSADENISNISSSSSKKNKKHKKKKEIDIKETIEDFVVNNEMPNPTNYIHWFFDDCFNYKDFLILFILYFVLSQEMIKDFFARYFTCLNPDDEGKIGVQGVIIYGLILTILFMIVKKFF
jgi:hypothetical protein